MSMVVGASIICLIIGIVLGAGIMFYVIRFRCKWILHGSGGGGPHYVSAKSQNLYVSLPMLDLTNTSTIESGRWGAGACETTADCNQVQLLVIAPMVLNAVLFFSLM